MRGRRVRVEGREGVKGRKEVEGREEVEGRGEKKESNMTTAKES